MPKDFTYEPHKGEIVKADAIAVREQAGASVVPFKQPEPVSLRESTFMAAGSVAVDPKQDRVLRRAVDPLGEIDILPSGEVYMSHVHFRRRLNDAFGPMGWALRPVSMPDISEKNTMFREFALIALGRVVATAIGSAKYFASNKRMDFGDTAEAVKSNALTRCSKDLGIGSECWDRHWAEEWKNAFAVHVWVIERDREDKTKKVTNDYWRRLDAKPFHGELEPVADSPNQDRWRSQITEWRARLEAEIAQSKKVADELNATRDRAREARRTQSAIDTNEVPKPTPPPAPKIQANQPNTRPAVAHAPGAINAADRPYLIKACTLHREEKGKGAYKLFRIEMMNGARYFTFSSRVYAEMQRAFAARHLVLIKAENQKASNGTVYAHIKEWQIRTSNGNPWGNANRGD